MSLSFEDFLINKEKFDFIVNEHKNLFLNKISTIQDKELQEKFIKILNLRLNGIIPDLLSLDNNCNFNWEYKFDPELIDYLDDFNKYYFSENYNQGLEQNFNENCLLPIIDKIKESRDNLKSICDNEITNPKKMLIHLYKSGDLYYQYKKKLQYILLVNKLKKFLELVCSVYPNITTLNTIKNKLSTTLDFSSFIQLFVSNISSSIREQINIIVKCFNPDSVSKNNIFNELFCVEKKINTLFWIIYSDDLKYIDSILRFYSLSDDYFAEIDKKIESTEEVSDECNKLFDGLENMKDEFIKVVVDDIRNIPEYKKLSQQQISDLIDVHIQKYTENISDPDDLIITKSSLEDCKSIIHLDLGIDKFIDIFSKFIK